MESFSYGLLIPCIVTALAALFLVATKEWHGRFSTDTAHGIQKFHISPTPRIGGVAIALGLAAAWLVAPGHGGPLFGSMLLAGIPAFTAGLLEDVTKKIGVKERLFATMTSGTLACVLTGYSLNHLEIPGLDGFLAWIPLSLAFTAFAVAGVANSVNIIDGFNGLAGGTLVICFSVLGMISVSAGDAELSRISFLLAAVTGGFLVVNFPFGKIFLGDGGAYLLGFLMAWVAVVLPMRNPSVSVWAPLLVCGYPVMETLFSMSRRLVEKADPGQPDSCHLHSMIKKRVVRRYFAHLPQTMRNSLVSPFCWTFALLPAAFAFNFYMRTDMLIASWAFMFAVYINIYQFLGWKMEEIDLGSSKGASPLPDTILAGATAAATAAQPLRRLHEPVTATYGIAEITAPAVRIGAIPQRKTMRRITPSFQPVMASAEPMAVAVAEPVVTEYYFKQLGNPSGYENGNGFMDDRPVLPDGLIPTLNILIAEDDKVSSMVLKSILKGMNITIFHAGNGREAVELARRHPEINIVLMDIKMPVMDGLEATKIIREMRPDLPVIAQSAYVSKEYRQKALDAGCESFISKPIRKEELLEAIQMQLNR
jgi:UDP-N-acetylmuramyl pentapeptide phosphotransferase/UDP-N-acetylglucosamine-1-phosphate transferase/CheY-like chemotaxis protein